MSIAYASHKNIDVVVIGAACLDVKARLRTDTVAGTSNPGDVRISPGGGARNISENLARLGMNVALLSVVCKNDFGNTIIRRTQEAGVLTDWVLRSDEGHSAAYIALLGSQGQLLMGVDDNQALLSITPDYIRTHTALLEATRMVVIDANISLEATETILDICQNAHVAVALDTVAYNPALRYRDLIGSFYLVTPNQIEAQALTGLTITNEAQSILAAKRLISAGVKVAIITCANEGVVYASASTSGFIPALEVDIVDPTGAGNALTATVIYALLNDIPLDEAIRLGVSAATLTLDSTETVCPDLSLESLYAQLMI